MSIFSAIGKGLKAVGKATLGVAKTGVNVATSVAGIGPIIPTNTNGGAQQAQAASINSQYYDGASQQRAGISIIDVVKDVGIGIGNFLNMRTHPQIDVNVGAGGRMSDPIQNNGLPSWLLPAGLIGGALLLIKSMSGGSRRGY